MQNNNTEDIERKALRIKEISLSLKEAIESGGKLGDLIKLIREYLALRKEIKKFMIEPSTIEILHNKSALSIIQSIANDNDTIIDKVLIRISRIFGIDVTLEELDSLDENELDKLGSDLFYSWFSHYEYIEGLYEIGSLVVGISIPSLLKKIVGEAKSCYTFQQYRAVFALCRSMLESCVKHICYTKELLPAYKIKNAEFWQLRDEVTKNNEILCNRCKSHYRKASKVIHGSLGSDIASKEARIFLKETLVLILDLYDYNNMKYSC